MNKLLSIIRWSYKHDHEPKFRNYAGGAEYVKRVPTLQKQNFIKSVSLQLAS